MKKSLLQQAGKNFILRYRIPLHHRTSLGASILPYVSQSQFPTKATDGDNADVSVELVMDKRLLFQYLQLKKFTDTEIDTVFDRIRVHESTQAREGNETKSTNSDEYMTISQAGVASFLLGRLKEIDAKQEEHRDADDRQEPDPIYDRYKRELMTSFAQLESEKAIKLLLPDSGKDIMKDEFREKMEALANRVDASRTIPISASMLVIGLLVGIIIPVMPYIVSNLGLTAGQYGIVVSSFAFAKLFANVPAAVFVDRHGRKPYLVYSLVIISMGVGGIGFASQFEHLIVCRMMSGFGSSLLRTAAVLTIADCSTPLNRARALSPMMSAAAAGMALGPGLGGLLADWIGVNCTCFLVGWLYLVLTASNGMFLTETKMVPENERVFPWQERRRLKRKEEDSILNSMQCGVSQWQPLLSDLKVRSVVMMNGFYWVALSGSQMTLLPLILTDPSGLAMSATNVGLMYMGMSSVQVFGNLPTAKLMDKIGKVPGIVAGCTLLSAAMFALPFCTEMREVAATLGFWALGSTMLSTAPIAYISDNVRDDQRAQALALLRTVGDVGFVVGASSTGAVADLFNMDVAVHSSATLLITATGWFAARRWLDWHKV